MRRAVTRILVGTLKCTLHGLPTDAFVQQRGRSSRQGGSPFHRPACAHPCGSRLNGPTDRPTDRSPALPRPTDRPTARRRPTDWPTDRPKYGESVGIRRDSVRALRRCADERDRRASGRAGGRAGDDEISANERMTSVRCRRCRSALDPVAERGRRRYIIGRGIDANGPDGGASMDGRSYVAARCTLGCWSFGRSVSRSVGGSVGRSVGRSVSQSVGRSVGRSVSQSVSRSVGWLVIVEYTIERRALSLVWS